MPIHDWTRVSAGTWHDFHVAWITAIRNVLNGGLMPPSYYAQAEQITGSYGPDVVALQEPHDPTLTNGTGEHYDDVTGAVAVALAPPRTRIAAKIEISNYARKRSTIVIRHSSGDRVVAFFELVSPGNKSSEFALRTFVDTAAESLDRGIHLLIADLFPPSPRDPNGIHGAIFSAISNEKFTLPPEEPLTLVAYVAGPSLDAYIEPTAVGRALIDMPVFLTPERYVNVPLESTYQSAYRGVPKKWRAVLEAPSAAP